MNLKHILKLLAFLGFKKTTSFPISLNGIWKIQGSKSHLVIDSKELVCKDGPAQLVMTPKIVNITDDANIKLHLHSLGIRGYPDKFNGNTWTALKWINKIKKYGIDVDVQYNNTNAFVEWSVKNTSGTCNLSRL